MTDTSTDPRDTWSAWVRRQLELHDWPTSELIRRGKPMFARGTVYKWLNGEHLPKAPAAKFVAEIFGADPREAYEAAGLSHLMDMEGDIVVAADPVEIFAARVRARRFPKPIEDRLIEYIRTEIKSRTEAFDELLDTVQDTQSLASVDNGDD